MNVEAPETRSGRPLVALICRVELLGEAVSGALDEIADVRTFRAGLGDTEGLLRSLHPHAIVVDDEVEANAALAYVAESDSALVHVSFGDGRLRLFMDGEWRDEIDGGISPEAIRNLLIGRLLGRASRV